MGVQRMPDDPKWDPVVSFWGMSGMKEEGYVPSPRYWFLWPGVMILLCYSMAEFLFNYRILWFGMKYGWQSMCSSLNALLAKRGKHVAYLEKQTAKENDESGIVEDFATQDQQVPILVWTTGCLVVLVVTIIIFEAQFQINGGLGILASILAIIFAFMSIHSSGVTDLTPLTASAKASQLVFGGVTQGMSENQALTTNLLAGATASAGADMSNTLISDYRTGFLLRTSPKDQFWAQAFGTLVAMFLAPGIFLLFTMAYPCILDGEAEDCEFPAPSVVAWRAVAEAVTMPKMSITLSSGIFSIVSGVICIVQVFVRRTYLVGAREKYQKFLPNWMGIGVAFVLPATHYSTAMFMGSLIAHFWLKKFPRSFEMYCYAIAAGLIAGEGMGGVMNAALTLGGVGGGTYGTNIACPADSC